jgi:hypothetical protein
MSEESASDASGNGPNAQCLAFGRLTKDQFATVSVERNFNLGIGAGFGGGNGGSYAVDV